jgi:hypothetical protein
MLALACIVNSLMSMQAFVRDLRESSEVQQDMGSLGGYELQDLVMVKRHFNYFKYFHWSPTYSSDKPLWESLSALGAKISRCESRCIIVTNDRLCARYYCKRAQFKLASFKSSEAKETLRANVLLLWTVLPTTSNVAMLLR